MYNNLGVIAIVFGKRQVQTKNVKIDCDEIITHIKVPSWELVYDDGLKEKKIRFAIL